MEYFNYILNQTSHAWNYYVISIIEFNTAYPILSIFTLIVLIILMVYLSIKMLKIPRPARKRLNIKDLYENPSPLAIAIESFLLPILSFPIYLLKITIIGLIKISFYFLSILIVIAVNVTFFVRRKLFELNLIKEI